MHVRTLGLIPSSYLLNLWNPRNISSKKLPFSVRKVMWYIPGTFVLPGTLEHTLHVRAG
jgi:hypothetical protein